MKFTFILIIILLTATESLFSQERPPKISLEQIRKDIEKLESEEEKLRTYVEMSNRHLRNSPDSLLVIAREIESLEDIDPKQKEAFTSFLTANAYRLLNIDSAIVYADKASGLLKDLNEHDSYLMMENLRAMQYTRRDQYLEAESLYLGAIEYREGLEEQVAYPIQFFYGNLGNMYVNVGAHDLAIQMFEKFLEYEDSPPNRCNILSKLATSFVELDDIDKAISMLRPCLEFENLPPPIKTIVRSNLSSIYKEKGDLDEATRMMEQATEISSRYRVPNLGNVHLARLGGLYLDQNMVDEADSVGNILLSTPPLPYSRPNEEIVQHEYFSRLYLEKGNYRKSLIHADKAIEISQKNNLPHMIREIYTLKSAAHEKLGELDQALANERLHIEHNERVTNLKEARNNEMLSVRYQLQNKEAQLLSANTELENVRLRNMIIITCLVLAAGYIFYRYRVYYLLKEEKTRNQIARDLHDDLSGTLSSISFFSEAASRVRKDPDESQRFLEVITKSAVEAKEKINDIIWAIDPSKDDWSVFLKKCKRFAADVLDSNDINYSIKIDESFSFPVRLEVRQNLWLIFKECITNLSKHSNATEVEIILTEENDKVYLKIIDNGIGFDPENVKNGHGIKNIRYRTEQIDGQVELKTDKESGTSWSFKFAAE